MGEQQSRSDEADLLKKAVSLSLEAGFQISKEALDLLRTLSKTEDPAELVKLAISRAKANSKQLVFLDKITLKKALEDPTSPREDKIAEEIVRALHRHCQHECKIEKVVIVASTPTQVSSLQYALDNVQIIT